MTEPLANRTARGTERTAGRYHRLLLVAAPAGAGKTAALREVRNRTGAALVNVNLELSRRMLEQNFLCYDGVGDVPGRIHGYLSTNFKDLRNRPKNDPELQAKVKNRWCAPDPSKAADLERLRERALLRAFEEYRKSEKRRLRVFRLEAVRAGFKRARRQSDYATVLALARKIPETILQEDPKLLMWCDQAITRTEGRL